MFLNALLARLQWKISSPPLFLYNLYRYFYKTNSFLLGFFSIFCFIFVFYFNTSLLLTLQKISSIFSTMSCAMRAGTTSVSTVRARHFPAPCEERKCWLLETKWRVFTNAFVVASQRKNCRNLKIWGRLFDQNNLIIIKKVSSTPTSYLSLIWFTLSLRRWNLFIIFPALGMGCLMFESWFLFRNFVNNLIVFFPTNVGFEAERYGFYNIHVLNLLLRF